MSMVRFFKCLFSCKTPPCSNDDWESVDYPPAKGERVLVKSRDGEVNIGHLDTEVENMWTAFMIEIAGKVYKFNIKEPYQWKEIPK